MAAGYLEIAEHLRGRIGSGAWGAGAPLPSEARLTAQWRTSRTTIRRALAVLETEGLIEAVQGRGRFVRPISGHGMKYPDAVFERIAALIGEEISGMAEGEQIDRETVLAERFGIAQDTVRQALSLLAEQGLIHAAHGRGRFVGPGNGAKSRTDEIAGVIRAVIAAGAIGDELPGEPTLAAEYGAARITVRRALEKLEAEGLIEKRSGLGRVVVRLPDGAGGGG